MKRSMTVFPYASPRRGSILLIVVALLAVLGLFATTLLYTSRLEVQASSNVGRAVQDRMAAVTGISDLLLYLEPVSGAQATTTTLLGTAQINASLDGLSSRRAADQTALFDINQIELSSSEENPSGALSAAAASPAENAIEDVAQKIPADVFEEFLRERMTQAGASSELAGAIVDEILKRNAVQEQTEVGVVEARGNADSAPAQTRRSAAGLISPRSLDNDEDSEDADEEEVSPPASKQTAARSFRSASELLRIPGMTPQIWASVEPFLTAHSSTLDVWLDARGRAYARAPINTLEPQELFTILQAAFPEKDENLLRQFAVNIVDRRDEDSIPTVYPDIQGTLPIIGYERNLVISEVCPDVMTLESDEDNGEYIEIFNPLSESVSLAGWTVSWSAGGMVLGQAGLNGDLAAGAHLIVTDDLKNDNDPTPEDDKPGMGSFYDVFKVLPLGNDRVIEALGMDIPNSRGTIALTDGSGNLIDYITYNGATFNGLNRGFAKDNLFVHTTTPGNALPFRNTLSPPAENGHEVACWLWMKQRMNTPFQSPGELLTVAQYFTPSGSLETADIPLFLLLNPEEDYEGLDPRVVDLFAVTEREKEMVLDDKGEMVEMFLATTRGSAQIPEGVTPAPLVYGRVNLNTAPVEILEMLPGFNRERALLLDRLRKNDASPLVLGRLSEWVSNEALWTGTNNIDRLRAFIHAAPLLTFHSSTWSVESLTAGRRARAVVSFRPEGGLDVHEWSYK